MLMEENASSDASNAWTRNTGIEQRHGVEQFIDWVNHVRRLAKPRRAVIRSTDQETMRRAFDWPTPASLAQASIAFSDDDHPCVSDETIRQAYIEFGGRTRERGSRKPYEHREVEQLVRLSRMPKLIQASTKRAQCELRFWKHYFQKTGLPALNVP